MSRTYGLVRGLSSQTRVFEIHFRIRMEFAIQPANFLQIGIDEIDGRKFTRRYLPRESMDRQRGWIRNGHCTLTPGRMEVEMSTRSTKADRELSRSMFPGSVALH